MIKKISIVLIVTVGILLMTLSMVPAAANEKQEVQNFADLFLDALNKADAAAVTAMMADPILLVWEEEIQAEYEDFVELFQDAKEMTQDQRNNYWEMLFVPEDKFGQMNDMVELIAEKGLEDEETLKELDLLIRSVILWQFATFATMDYTWQADAEQAAIWINESQITDNGFIVPRDMIVNLLELEDMEEADEAYDEIIISETEKGWLIEMFFPPDDWGEYEIIFVVEKIDGKWLITELH